MFKVHGNGLGLRTVNINIDAISTSYRVSMEYYTYTIILFIICLSSHRSSASKQLKNVLFLVSDDMRPELGVYNGQDAPSPVHPKMHTPNLDNLARRSLLLKKAYVQQALCSPSRTSLLTGRRPDTTHVYDLLHYFRHVGGNFTTIPQYFKEHGYETIGMGKVFHPGKTSGYDDPISWTQPYYHGNNGKWNKYAKYSMYSINDSLLVNNPLEDQMITARAIETLQSVAPAALKGERPFFVAVGFHRPHLPFLIPQSFMDLYPPNLIKLPNNPYAPVRLPEIAWSDFADLRNYEDMKEYGHGQLNTSFPDDVVLRLRRGYYASVSYTDSLIGKVLQTLKTLGLENSTIVSFWGDHGWNLGEHGEWCKHNNFETSTRAPMMIKIPGLTDKGIETNALTEFVDLFPTLAEGAGLPSIPLCPHKSSSVKTCTEGVSMIPLLSNPKQQWKKAAFSQYPRMDIGGGVKMGYTMRTSQYRFSQYVEFEPNPSYSPYWNMVEPFGGPGGELYDHKVDPEENWNRYGEPGYKSIQLKLTDMLHKGWRNALPTV